MDLCTGGSAGAEPAEIHPSHPQSRSMNAARSTIPSLLPALRGQDLVSDRQDTSTTVASYAVPGDRGRGVKPRPIPILQELPDGRKHVDHLVPSAITLPTSSA